MWGGLLTWKTRNLVENLFRVSFREQFSVENDSSFYSLYKHFKEKARERSSEPFYFVKRKKYDQELVSLAQKKSCRFLNRVTLLKAKEKETFPSHLAPAGNFLTKPGFGRILLLGDAAGLADPLTGEGIYYAHRSAEMASKAVEDYFRGKGNIDLVESYRNYLRPVYERLKLGRALGNLGYTRLRYAVYWLNRSWIYKKLVGYIHGIKINLLD